MSTAETATEGRGPELASLVKIRRPLQAGGQLGCHSDRDCERPGRRHDRFCFQGLDMAINHPLNGACLGCWQCCLFPEVFGECPLRCGCGRGVQECEQNSDCDWVLGHFCLKHSRSQISGTCEACWLCHESAFPAYCDRLFKNDWSSKIQANISVASMRDFVYTFKQIEDELKDITNRDKPFDFSKASFSEWLLRMQLGDGTEQQRDFAFDSFDTDGSGAVSITELAFASLEVPEVTLCPPAHTAETVFGGCPCTFAAGASHGRCRAGFKCSEAGAWLKPMQLLGLASASLSTGAICWPCDPGDFCAEGTVDPLPAWLFSPTDVNPSNVTQENAAMAQLSKWLQCPAGFYCPTPAEKLECPAGSYCVPGSTTPDGRAGTNHQRQARLEPARPQFAEQTPRIRKPSGYRPRSCNISQLLKEEASAPVPRNASPVLERVYLDKDPLYGNFCPLESSQPTALCKAGKHCPVPGLHLECPKGSYCPAQSSRAIKCGLLWACPAGSSSPAFAGNGTIFTAALLIIFFVLALVQRTIQRRSAASVEQRRLNDSKITALKRLFLHLKQNKLKMDVHFQGFTRCEPRIWLEFDNLGLTLASGATILAGVSGHFRPGEISAILGPSGAGKSTFLNTLAGKATYGHQKGVVRINGKADLRIRDIKRVVGFVPQSDIVYEGLTVRENLLFSALLRLPGDMPGDQRALIVEDTLEVLYLSHVKDSLVGSVERRGISGGQRKRVNIGWEVVSQPSMLFLDEPTTGLDASSSQDILFALDKFVSLGANVAAVIHQPRYRIFAMFDQVLLLGVGGQTVYFGPPAASYYYFRAQGFIAIAEINRADFCLDVISGKIPREGGEHFTPQQLPSIWQQEGPRWLEMQGQQFRTDRHAMVDKHCQGLPPEVVEQLLTDFDRIDEDGSGALSAQEIHRMMYHLGVDVDMDLVEDLVAEIDYDGDNQLTKSELMRMLLGDEAFYSYQAIQEHLMGGAPHRASAAGACGRASLDGGGHYSMDEGGDSSRDRTAEGQPGLAERAAASSRRRGGEGGGVASAEETGPDDDVDGGHILLTTPQDSLDSQPSTAPAVLDDSTAAAEHSQADVRQQAALSRAARPGSGKAATEEEAQGQHRGPGELNGDRGAAGPAPPPMPQDEAGRAGRPAAEQSGKGWRQSEAEAWPRYRRSGSLSSCGSLAPAGRTDGPVSEAEQKPPTLEDAWADVSPTQDSSARNKPGSGAPEPVPLPRAQGAEARMAVGAVEAEGLWQRLFGSVSALSSLWEQQQPLFNRSPAGSASSQHAAATALPMMQSMTPWIETNPIFRDSLEPRSSRSTASDTYIDPSNYLPASSRQLRGGAGPVAEAAGRIRWQHHAAPSPQLRPRRTAAGMAASWQSRPAVAKRTWAAADCTLQPVGEASRMRRHPSDALGSRSSASWLNSFSTVASSFSTNRRIIISGHDGKPMIYTGDAVDKVTGLHRMSASERDVRAAVRQRKAPNRAVQYMSAVWRCCLQLGRNFMPTSVIDFMLMLIAAHIVGFVHGKEWDHSRTPTRATMAVTVLAVLSTVTHLRTFSCGRELWWRESSTGFHPAAHWLANNTMDLIYLLALPATFAVPYYYLTLPRMTLWGFYVVCVLVCWWVSGMAYIIGIILDPGSVLVVGVFIALILGAFFNGLNPSIAEGRGALEVVLGLGFNRWAMEAITVAEMMQFPASHRNVILRVMLDIGLCGVDRRLPKPAETLDEDSLRAYMEIEEEGFDVETECMPYWWLDACVLFGEGLVLRIIALVLLSIMHRDKRV